jgi:hypothetical protein
VAQQFADAHGKSLIQKADSTTQGWAWTITPTIK